MHPTWLIQSTGRNDRSIHQEVDSLIRCHIPWHEFGVIPTTTEVTGLDDVDPDKLGNFVIRGGTKILEMLEADPSLWMTRGVFYDKENFDQHYYRNFDLPMLNSDALYFDLVDHSDLSFDELRFVKPSSDLKAFTAGLLEPGQTVQDYIRSQTHQPGAFAETVLVSSPKNVIDEYRFFVIDGHVLTGSQYRVNRQLKYRSLDWGTEHTNARMAARDFAKLYHPADVFTLDVCKTDDGAFSIIEYNCFNASGLYACDHDLLFRTVSDFVTLTRK